MKFLLAARRKTYLYKYATNERVISLKIVHKFVLSDEIKSIKNRICI